MLITHTSKITDDKAEGFDTVAQTKTCLIEQTVLTKTPSRGEEVRGEGGRRSKKQRMESEGGGGRIRWRKGGDSRGGRGGVAWTCYSSGLDPEF